MFKLLLLNNRYPALHGLRCLGFLVILVGHVRPHYFQSIGKLWFAMDIFFVLSGYLIGLILLQQQASDKSSIGQFYVRRSFRIVPLYFVVLTFATLWLPVDPVARSEVWREYLYLTNIVRTPDTFVMFWGWSLAVEEHFYLVVPLLTMLLAKIKRPVMAVSFLAAIWLSCYGLRLSILGQSGIDYDQTLMRTYYATYGRYDELIAGILIAYLSFHFPSRIASLASRRWVRVALPATGIVCFALCTRLPSKIPVFDAAAFSIASIGVAAILLWVNNVPTLVSRLLSHRVFLYLATLTYGSYLVHLYVLRYAVRPALAWVAQHGLVLERFGTWLAEIGATFALSLSVAYLMHVLIEKPLLILRDRFDPEMRNARETKRAAA